MRTHLVFPFTFFMAREKVFAFSAAANPNYCCAAHFPTKWNGETKKNPLRLFTNLCESRGTNVRQMPLLSPLLTQYYISCVFPYFPPPMAKKIAGGGGGGGPLFGEMPVCVCVCVDSFFILPPPPKFSHHFDPRSPPTKPKS